MNQFTDYECLVIRALLRGHFSVPEIDTILQDAEFISEKHSGCGYFLTVKHPLLPIERVVCTDPAVEGRIGDIFVGFLLFLGEGELMLECCSYATDSNPDGDVPSDIREQELDIDVEAKPEKPE